MRMKNQVSIVTGSTSGLGKAIAHRFAEEGAKVVVTGRSLERGGEVVDSIRAAGGVAHFVACDLGDEGSIEGLVRVAVEEYGGISNVVMNAAATGTSTGERGRTILDLDNDIMDKAIATNVRGLLWLFKYSLPRLAESARPEQGKTTSIVTIGTSGTRNGTPGMPVYWTTKAPVEVMTRSLAREFGGRGVRVNCVSAGLIETESEMSEMTPEFRAQILSLNALPFFGQPEDIAAAVTFLSSDEARYITGTTLCVNGGVAS
jgi:NAD(P)-dependent dehydrogenase (short-subunit alcohol dehydrogenase family)